MTQGGHCKNRPMSPGQTMNVSNAHQKTVGDQTDTRVPAYRGGMAAI